MRHHVSDKRTVKLDKPACADIGCGREHIEVFTPYELLRLALEIKKDYLKELQQHVGDPT
jgi:hypothetical protein